MKKSAFFAALAAVAVVGCNKQEIENPIDSGRSIVVHVTAENNPTKGDYDEEGQFIWAEGDQIGVKMYGGEGYNPWMAPLTLKEDCAGSADGTFYFDGEIGSDVHYGVAAFYPYDGDKQPASNVGGDGNFYFYLPPTLAYDSNVRMPLLAAITQDQEIINLKQAGAGIRISLNNVPARATKVTLTTEGKTISGWTSISLAEVGSGSIGATTDGIDGTVASSSVTYLFDADDDVRENMVFTFPVPVQDYSRITVTVADDAGTIWTKKGTVNTSPGRGEILAMPELTVKDLAKNFYLVGYLNGKDYTGQDYPFVDGKLTTWFTQDSYVYIIDGNGKKYWFPKADDAVRVNTGTLYLWQNQSDSGQKMYVPADAVLDFSLEDNGDNSLTLSYQIKDPAFVCDVPSSNFLSPYWNNDLTATRYNVAPPISMWASDPAECVFENNLNISFVTDDNGVVELNNPDVTDVRYFFGALEKQTVNGQDVEFTVSEDGLELSANRESIAEVIATIDNDGEGYTPNIITLNKESSLAKDLLNTGQFHINLGAKGYLSGNPKLEGKITFNGKDYFRADYVCPVEIIISSSEDYLKDGVELGAEHSYVSLDSFVDARDFRGRLFSNFSNYWDYYGPTSVSIKNLSYRNSDGSSHQVPDDWGIKYYTEDGINEALQGTEYAYTLEARLGFLVLQSQNTSVNDCTLCVDVAITYGWGTIVPETILVSVKNANSE